MTIKNTVSNVFYLRSSIVLAFLIAAYPVCLPTSSNRMMINLRSLNARKLSSGGLTK